MTIKKTSAKKGKVVRVVVPQVPKKKKKPKAPTQRGVLKGLGEIAGTYLGGPIGGKIGSAAGGLLSRITGMGDYKVNQNSIVQGNSVPTFQSESDGMRVCHREFLADVVGSVDFTLTTYPINPGLSRTFPLLSLIAQTFEEIEWDGLVFEYRPSSGSAVSSTSSALGVVILATDYDAANPPFFSKQQMESYEFSTSTVPFTGCLHPVECMKSRNVLENLYVRKGPQPLGTDIRMFDLGNFQIATQGMQSAYTVGELWVSYDARFRKPRIQRPLGGYARFVVRDASGSNFDPWGTFGPQLTVDSDPLLASVRAPIGSSSFFIVLPNTGNYLVGYYTNNNIPTSFGYNLFTTALGANLAVGPLIFAGSTSSAFALASNVTGGSCTVNCITCVADGESVANEFAFTSSGSWTGGFVTLIILRLLEGSLPAPPVFRQEVHRFFMDPFAAHSVCGDNLPPVRMDMDEEKVSDEWMDGCAS